MGATSPPRHVPLLAGHRAVLAVEAFPALSATVAAVAPREATLVLAPEGAPPVRVLHQRPAELESERDGLRYRAGGEVAIVMGRGGTVREGVLAFRFAGGPVQRRVAPRAPAVLPVTLVPVEAELPAARGLTVNVSATGLLLSGPVALDAGAPLGVVLELPGDAPRVPAAGEVVRTTPDGLRGVRLDRMRPADRERVERWLREAAG
jgi:hypothetical protein